MKTNFKRVLFGKFQRIFCVQKYDFNDVWPKIDKVEGFLLPGQERWLFETMKSLPDGARAVEIGAFKGRSTVSLAFGCIGSRRSVVSIDKYQGVYEDVEENASLSKVFSEGFFNEWKANVERNELSDYVLPMIGDADDISKHWRAEIHLLFIDGSHKYEDVLKDFSNFFPYVVPNGFVALHDVTKKWQGPFRAWQEVIKHKLKDTGFISTLAYGRKPI